VLSGHRRLECRYRNVARILSKGVLRERDKIGAAPVSVYRPTDTNHSDTLTITLTL
jgi:hypothetical protein